MSLRLRHYPDPVLREVAQPVDVTDEVRSVAERMIEIMRASDGVGLAAPQVGLAWRLFVCDVPENDGRSASADPPTATDGPVVYVNPVLSRPAGGVEPYEEGCLSLPGIRGDVLRPPQISITALGLDGARFTSRGGGLLARCWQHEMDHLDGVLIIDKMLAVFRLKNRDAIRELEQNAAE